MCLMANFQLTVAVSNVLNIQMSLIDLLNIDFHSNLNNAIRRWGVPFILMKIFFDGFNYY